MAYRANRGSGGTDPERAAKDQRNAEVVKQAADVAQHSANPYAKAAGTAVKVGDKVTGGQVSNKIGKTMRNSPAEKVLDRAMPAGKKDSKLTEMFQKNAMRKATNRKPEVGENSDNLEGEQKSSPSSSSKNGENKKKKDNSKVADSSSNSSSNRGGNRKRGNDSSASDDASSDAEIQARRRMRIIIAVSALASVFLLAVVLIAIIISTLGILTKFDDALGVSSYTGRNNGNVAYGAESKEQSDFYERVNDVELEFLARGEHVDALKIAAVYYVLKENDENITYEAMTEDRIRDIANAMLNGGTYDEDTFKTNLINNIFPQYFPNSTKKEREAMANSVLEYTNDYYKFIDEEPPSVYNDCTSSSGSCSYNIKGFYIKGKGNITKNIQVSNLYVRLMQCGTANGHNYGGTFGKPLEGEELVPFEKYILGVAYQEIGASSPAEAIKAQMVAARSYILARHVDMGGWRSLKQENGKWILQAAACTQDQVYCDPDKGCSGTNGQWGQVYSGQGHNKGFSKGPLSQSSPLRTYANQTSGEVLTNNNGYIVYSGYTQTEQTKMISLANQGKNYKQILLQIYNQGSRNYGASAVSKAACNSGSNLNCTTSTGAYSNWKQSGASWSNVKMGTSGRTIGQIGCLVTSIAMLISKSGVQTTIANFNPGTFVDFLNKNGGFDSSGNLQYGPISKAAPSFRWVKQVNLVGSREQKLNTIRNYQSQGYYMTAEVSTNGQHWVAIDSVNGNSIKIMDPATNITDLWASGKYTPSSTKTLNLFKVG